FVQIYQRVQRQTETLPNIEPRNCFRVIPIDPHGLYEVGKLRDVSVIRSDRFCRKIIPRKRFQKYLLFLFQCHVKYSKDYSTPSPPSCKAPKQAVRIVAIIPRFSIIRYHFSRVNRCGRPRPVAVILGYRYLGEREEPGSDNRAFLYL